MKRLFVLLVMAIFLMAGCVSTIRDVEDFRNAGKFASVTEYSYSLEEVYAATKYILLHTENLMMCTYQFTYIYEEGVIWLQTSGGMFNCKFIEGGIFFVRLGKSKTRLEIVAERMLFGPYINDLVDEIKYYLDNGIKKYREYTNHILREREGRAREQLH